MEDEDENYDYDEEPDDYPSDESIYDSDGMSVVTGSEVEFIEGENTTPRAVTLANSFLPLNSSSNLPEPSTPPKPVETPSNTFTSVNTGRAPGTITPFAIRNLSAFSLDGPPPAASGQPAGCLPVGWSETAFEDLAPFIIAETNTASLRSLAPQHKRMLEEWRTTCPPSRLLQGLRYYSPLPLDSETHLGVTLSHLLARVDSEMAGYWR